MFRDLPRFRLRQRATTLGPKGVRQARNCCNGCHRYELTARAFPIEKPRQSTRPGHLNA